MAESSSSVALVWTPKRKSSPYASMPAKTASRFSSGSAPWKTICGSVPLGTVVRKYSLRRSRASSSRSRDMCWPPLRILSGM